MTSLDQPLPGVHLLKPKVFEDERGDFVKTYHEGLFEKLGITFKPVEEFFSTSRKNVLRGMHFQIPPHDHDKLVYCIRGRVLDVLLDLRSTSPTYKMFTSAELSRENHHQFFIPRGVAHGFLALEDDSVMVYKTSTVHAPTHDSGVFWDSFGYDWNCFSPVISDRDRKFQELSELALLF
jgi:dTDP-4-dehydrorhamnose 3,5-epimerase/CDP-3, 6-dideoxy-D-glycero-D-glycero-4-hexulose-5-epimerase